MHGSALGEARSAASIGRRVLQLGVYVQELATALCSARRGRREREHPPRQPVRPPRDSPRRGRPLLLGGGECPERASPRCCLSARSTGASAGASCSTAFLRTVRAAHPDRDARLRRSRGARGARRDLSHGHHRRGAGRPVPPRVGVCLAEHLRGVRPAVSRGDGVRHAGRGVAESRQRARCSMTADAACSRPTTPSTAKLAALLGDTARRRELSACGLSRAREYSLSRMLGNYEELLFELTEVDAGAAAASDRSRTRPWRRSRDPLRRRGRGPSPTRPARRDGDRWGWVEIFLAIQLLWGAALFVPGAQAYRTAGAGAAVPGERGGARLLLPRAHRRTAARERQMDPRRRSAC